MGVREVGLVGGDNRGVVKGEDTGESSTSCLVRKGAGCPRDHKTAEGGEQEGCIEVPVRGGQWAEIGRVGDHFGGKGSQLIREGEPSCGGGWLTGF